MTWKKRIKRRKIIVSAFSAVARLSISNAFESSPNIHLYRTRSSLEGGVIWRPLSTGISSLYSVSGIDNNAIMDRQGFLIDALWSTTSSSVAIASATTMDVPSKTKTKDAELICQNGALLGEAAVPGAYSSACMGLSERVVPLPRYRERVSAMNRQQIASKDVQLMKDDLREPGTIVVQQKAGGSGNTGMTVWNSGLLLTRLLDVMVEELQRRQGQKDGESSSDNAFWRNQDVIELGCGTGLCSIAAHRLGAKSVMATDGNPRVLQLAETNIQQNCRDRIDRSGATGDDETSNVSNGRLSTIRAEPLQWGFLNAMDYSESASFVIGADLTYNPGSWDILAETIATLLKTENNNIIDSVTAATSKQCYALYLSVGHDGFNVNAEVDGFLSVAKEKGLVTIADGVEGIDLNDLLQRTLSDTEKKILAQSGGFRVVVLGRKSAKRR